MSMKVRYPNGSIGFASDKVAAILEKRPGHKVLGNAKAAAEPEKKADPDREKK